MNDDPPKAAHAKAAKRVSGKPVAILVAAVLVIGAVTAVTLWFRGRVPSGPISTIVGIDADRAALLRQGFEERGYTHLVVWVRDGGQRWSEALFGVQSPPSLAVLDGRVLARVTEARGNPSLHAFDIETGEFLWRGPYPHPERTRVPFDGPTLHVAGGVAFEVIGGDPIEVLVVDSAGALVATQTFPRGSGEVDAFVRGEQLLLNTGSGWIEIDTTGDTRPSSELPRPTTMTADPGETCEPSRVGDRIWSCRGDEVVAR